METYVAPLSAGHFRGVDTGVCTVVEDAVLDVELLTVELTLELALELETELTLEVELILAVDVPLKVELALDDALLPDDVLLPEDDVLLAIEEEPEELLLRSSLNSVRPLGPPQVSVLLALHGMLQRPSVTGRELVFNVLPQ